MNFLLDTNACIRLLNRSCPGLARQFRSTPPSRLRLCSIVKAELDFGARRSGRAEEAMQKLRRFYGPLKSLPFDDRCAEHAGALRAELAGRGAPLGAHDLLIAATALAYGVTLVTHNVREFQRVPGLRWVDWEQD